MKRQSQSPALLQARSVARRAFCSAIFLPLFGLGGCLFDGGPLEAIRCGADGDCAEGKICVDGFCQTDRDAPDLCASDAECADDQFCNGTETCAPGAPGANESGCVPGTTLEVDDGIACTRDICDEANDEISNIPGPECDCPNGSDVECQVLLAAEIGVDIEAVLDLCVSATCNDQFECVRASKAAGESCDDGLSCTGGDVCDGQGACNGAPDDGQCDDGAFCNGAEACSPGTPGADGDGCTRGVAPEVDDGDDCTIDRCDEEADEVTHEDDPACPCQEDSDCVPEEGANDCERYFCTDNVCGSEPLPRNEVCDDGLSCTSGDTCDGNGTCGGTPVNALCDDGAFCNGAELCDPESRLSDETTGCIPGTPPEIDDDLECTIDICDEQGDRVINDPSNCPCPNGDGDCVPQNPNPCLEYVCSEQQTCVTNVRGENSPCDDGLGCTANDACQAGSCVGVPSDAACEDDLFCNGTGICQPGHPEADDEGCRAQGVPVVDDGIACTDDRCDEDRDEVVHTPNDGRCDDSVFCNGVEACDPGGQGADEEGCVAGAPLDLSDGVACTDDRCDEAGDQIVHENNDANCDDALFCNGTEVCDPGGQGADAEGCATGGLPQVDDGIPCTDDRCDEDRDEVVNDPNDANCGDELFCNGDELCDPSNVNADAEGCAAGFPADPDDGIPCTFDSCDEVDDLFVNTPSDELCNDGLFCNGAETCDPEDPEAVEGCLDGDDPVDTHPDQRPCVVLTCDEGSDSVDVDESNCGDVCEDDADCQGQLGQDDVCTSALCDPGDENAEVDGCVFADLDDDTACDLSCENGAASGTCQGGACEVLPEGPTGTGLCGDGQDNDCDGDIDGGDSDCGTPDALEISAPPNASVGFGQGAGVLIEVTPREGGDPVTHQDLNLYCTSRIVDTEHTFEQDIDTFAARSDVQILDELGDEDPDAEGITTQVPFEGDNDLQGMEICDGYSVLLGPYSFPPAVEPVYGFMLEVTMGYDTGGLGLGEYLVASYKTNGTQNKFVPLVATVGGEGVGLQTYRFSLFNGGGFQNAQIRLDIIASDGDPEGACGFVETVRLDRIPRILSNNNRLSPQWTFGNTTEPASQLFGTDITGDFFSTLNVGGGDHTLLASAEANNNIGLGAEWAFTGGVLGAVAVPPIESYDTGVDRANPLMFDFRATTSQNTFLFGELAHAGFFIGNDLSTLRKVASIFPANTDEPAHFVSHYDLGGLTTQNRYMVILPEEAKPLFGRNFGYASTPLFGDDKRVYLDDINLYYHTLSTAIDLDVEVLGPVSDDSPVHQIRLQHANAGQAHVQCYWQIPGDADTDTISSAPVRVTFE